MFAEESYQEEVAYTSMTCTHVDTAARVNSFQPIPTCEGPPNLLDGAHFRGVVALSLAVVVFFLHPSLELSVPNTEKSPHTDDRKRQQHTHRG